MIGPLGRLGAAVTLRQHCPQMTQRPGTSVFGSQELTDSYFSAAAADGGGGGGVGGIVAMSANTNNINEDLDNVQIEIASNKRMRKDNIKPFRLTFKDKELEKKACNAEMNERQPLAESGIDCLSLFESN